MIPTFVLSSLWPEGLLFLCNLPHGRFFLFLVYTSLPWALDFGFWYHNISFSFWSFYGEEMDEREKEEEGEKKDQDGNLSIYIAHFS